MYILSSENLQYLLEGHCVALPVISLKQIFYTSLVTNMPLYQIPYSQFLPLILAKTGLKPLVNTQLKPERIDWVLTYCPSLLEINEAMPLIKRRMN